MKWKARTLAKLAGVAAALLLAAGIAAPYINADGYGERLRRSMERALGRQVEFKGSPVVQFSLFAGGFTAENVVIHEDPSIGIEPIAYMDSVTLRPALLPLLAGRFVIASIKLEGPAAGVDAGDIQSIEVSVGPFLVDVSGTSLDGGVQQVFDTDVPAGSYRTFGSMRAALSVHLAGTRLPRPARVTSSVVKSSNWSGYASVIKTSVTISEITADWRPVEMPKLPEYPVQMPAKFTEKIISDPEASQLHVFLGHPGIKRDNPDYYRLLVMDNVLGTGAVLSLG